MSNLLLMLSMCSSCDAISATYFQHMRHVGVFAVVSLGDRKDKKMILGYDVYVLYVKKV